MFTRSFLALTVLPMLLIGLADAQKPQVDRVARLFEELTNALGPTGFEGPVREILVRELEAAGVEVPFLGADHYRR